MASERDLSDLLPPSPPPRADRREAAIDAALRRFDGAENRPVRHALPPRRRSIAGSPQLGMLAAAALVAAIGLPLWLSGEHHPPAVPGRPAAIEVSPPADPAAMADVATAPADIPSDRPPAMVAPPGVVPAAPPAARAATPAPSVAPAAPPAIVAPPDQRAALAAAPPPPPAAMAAPSQQDAVVGSDIVVTGARVTGRAGAERRIDRRLAQRGDWNRCTIDDPRRDEAACRQRGAATPKRQATDLVADGLASAWRNDTAGAIAAFDRAIAVSPRLGTAWLNRGLAHARAGDEARALADLDQAVRYAPRDARGWYQRSLILRRTGRTARADDDAARAVELDERYEAVVE